MPILVGGFKTMVSTLIFPDGIRLAQKDEIPGPEPQRSAAWARVQSANISSGFVVKQSDDAQFSHYAEINVDAPRIWTVFGDLCLTLLGPIASLFIGNANAKPIPVVGSGRVPFLITTLEPHKYQLAQDGFLEFGLMSDSGRSINEVFVRSEKHFRVWLNDEKRFKEIMKQHELREADHMEFLDEYPRTCVQLPENMVAFPDLNHLLNHLASEITATSGRDEHN